MPCPWLLGFIENYPQRMTLIQTPPRQQRDKNKGYFDIRSQGWKLKMGTELKESISFFQAYNSA